MAEDRISTIIDVQLNENQVAEDLAKAVKQVQLLKQEQKLLDKALAEGRISEENYGKAMAQSNAELEKATRATKGYTAQLKVLSDETGQYGDSLNEQRRKLNDMQKAYDDLSADIRNSKAGREFLQQIQEQDKAVKEMEQSTGRFGRSVGSYEEALKNAGVGIGGFTAKMKAFFANPWGLLLTAIVAAFTKLISAFKGSEDRMNEMRKAFAPLKGVGDMITQTFDKLASTVGTLLVGALQKATEGIKWLFAAIDRLANKLGLDWNLSAAFEAVAENSEKATEAEQKYIEHRRRWIEEEAKLERQVAELREKTVEKDKYSAEERAQFMERALAIEEKMSKERMQLAKENLAYLEAEGNRSENDAEMNDRLAEARAAVTREETNYLNTVKTTRAQILKFRKEELKETREDEKEALFQQKEYEKRTKASLDFRLQTEMAALGKEKELSREAFEANQRYFTDLMQIYAEDSEGYFNAVKLKEQYEQQFQEKRKQYAKQAETFLAQFYAADVIADKYNKQLEQLDQFLSNELISVEEYEQAKAEIEERYRLSKAERDAALASQILNQAQQLNSAISSIENASLKQYEKEQNAKKKALERRLNAGVISQENYAAEVQKLDEETERKKVELERQQAVREKALGIMNASIATAVSIIKMLADPGGFAGIALSVLAGITGAAQVAAIAAEPLPQFEHGGTISGTSYTGDKVLVRANSGEGIYNGTQANNLLQEIANNPARGGYDQMTAAFSQALRDMPSPVLEYSEMQQFERNVVTYNEIAKI